MGVDRQVATGIEAKPTVLRFRDTFLLEAEARVESVGAIACKSRMVRMARVPYVSRRCEVSAGGAFCQPQSVAAGGAGCRGVGACVPGGSFRQPERPRSCFLLSSDGQDRLEQVAEVRQSSSSPKGEIGTVATLAEME